MAKNQQQTGYAAPSRPNPGNWVVWIGLIVAVAVGGAIAWTALAPGARSGVPQAKIEDPPIECNPCQPHKHQPEHIEYKTDPPTSGLHYDATVNTGVFYDQVMNKENLVHNLEHGNIVIYYDPKISADVKAQLKGLAERNKAPFAGIVVVPRPEGDSPLILTAWGHTMRLQGYDKRQIDGFIGQFMGKGPERATP